MSHSVRSLETRIDGPILIEPVVHGDERGFFQETFRQNALAELGAPENLAFVQDNHSRSRRGVVRGMHLQVGEGVAKLVRCARGTIFDAIVDVRQGSPHYGQWEGFELSDANHHQLLVPVGFAHGFCVISDVADVIYKQSGYYDPQLERGISYDDPEVGIRWPLPPAELIPSARDAAAPKLREVADELGFSYGSSNGSDRERGRDSGVDERSP
jgi:dTDP-4-dehydrorhamnose 3,5-epimerase